MNAALNQSQLANSLAQQAMPIAQIDTGATAVAAYSKAKIEAHFLMALHRQRNWDKVRQELLRECSIPAFAMDKSTYYKKPLGGGKFAEGLGIRFAEAAIRCMTNIMPITKLVHENELFEMYSVEVIDLESNIPYSSEFPVSKTVERSKPHDDGTHFGWRLNSDGNKTFTVRATEDALLNKRNMLISKALRGSTLRLVPIWLQTECEARINEVRLAAAKENPDAERHRIIDGFARLNVRVTDLVLYLGHDVALCSPAQLVELRALWSAIDSGDATWPSIMESRETARAQVNGADSAGDPTGANGASGARTPKAKSTPTPPPPPPETARAAADPGTGDLTGTQFDGPSKPAGDGAAASTAQASTSTPAANAPAANEAMCSGGQKKYLVNRTASGPVTLRDLLQQIGMGQLMAEGEGPDDFLKRDLPASKFAEAKALLPV